MAHPELVEALRAAAEEKAAAIREAARAEAEQYRAAVARKTAAERARATDEAAASARAQLAAATAEAEGEARGIILAARAALAEQLYRLARECLPRFREERYEALFDALAGEVPDRAWPVVRINPADRDLAERRFPDAEVIAEETIAAGLVVESDDGRIRVDNTLEKRLARAWPGLLPGLVREALEETRD